MRREAKEVVLDSDGVLRIRGSICVPKLGELTKLILEETHYSQYSIHPGAAKIYHDLSQHYWWTGMKRDMADFVSRLTKSAHIIPIWVKYMVKKLAELYISQIVRLHGVLISIVSDRVELGLELSFEEESIAILDMQVRKLSYKEIASVKVQWKYR
ncbi:hypothetical protein MTR67_026942 [Solanum verrucosum]|uniref:Integrase zinc-binding domain-containing protein n=1 Tax=Solanum verrucosum TaxID=315347 RepID=A0AAF0R436_SOLVR|nr:hypothetical protein MTR67_026942 [Solanum verrucosum]